MTRAIRIHEHGGPEVLRLDEVQVGVPGVGEARVRHTAVGVNFIDTYHRSGLYALPSMPHGIGMEAAGVVEAVGGDVSSVSVGDRVAYVAAPPGAYADRRIVPADRLVRLPDPIDDETAAAMMLKGMTVEYLTHRTYPVQPGQTVLFHAAAGGVGLLACQWLAHRGVTVIGTVGSDKKAELARAHGCTHPVVYTRESVVDRVWQITDGAGVPVVYDSVGRATFDASLDCLAPRGMLVSFGNSSGPPPALELATLSAKGSLYVTRPSLMHYVARREELEQSACRLFDVVSSDAVTVEVHHRWPLADAAEAHRALEGRRTTASSVLKP